MEKKQILKELGFSDAFIKEAEELEKQTNQIAIPAPLSNDIPLCEPVAITDMNLIVQDSATALTFHV